jgi:hypothetical protein
MVLKQWFGQYMTVQPKTGGTVNGRKQKIFPAKIGYLWNKILNTTQEPSLLKTTSEIDSR